MKRALVTGAGGFIGRQCLPHLSARGYEIHGVELEARFAPGLDVEWHSVDLLDSASMSSLVAKLQPSHLLHLAWETTPGDYWQSPMNLTWLSVSLGLLADFSVLPGSRIVGVGTCAEYDWGTGVCSEDLTPLRQSSLYGVCKHSLQLVLGKLASARGLSAAWGRIFYLYGPHEHPARVVPYVVQSLLRGEPARCTPGDQIRDFLHVGDVGSALVALLDSDVSGPVNIGSGQPVSLKQLLSLIGRKIGREDLLQFGALPIPPGDPAFVVADVRRLREEVGWQPALDLSRGLDHTIAWWRETLERAGLPPKT